MCLKSVLAPVCGMKMSKNSPVPWRNTGCTVRMGILGLVRQKLRAAGSLPELEISGRQMQTSENNAMLVQTEGGAVLAQSTCQASRNREKGSLKLIGHRLSAKTLEISSDQASQDLAAKKENRATLLYKNE